MANRTKKEIWYLKIAKTIAERSPCTRRKFGAILVRGDAIISTGYNGSPRETLNCGLDVSCIKDRYQELPYLSYDHCPAVHAEENAIINAARSGVSTVGATLYLASAEGKCQMPCQRCRRAMINAGIAYAYYYETQPTGTNIICDMTLTRMIKLENDWIEEQSVRDVK